MPLFLQGEKQGLKNIPAFFALEFINGHGGLPLINNGNCVKKLGAAIPRIKLNIDVPGINLPEEHLVCSSGRYKNDTLSLLNQHLEVELLARHISH
jgi:hypothetical protein